MLHHKHTVLEAGSACLHIKNGEHDEQVHMKEQISTSESSDRLDHSQGLNRTLDMPSYQGWFVHRAAALPEVLIKITYLIKLFVRRYIHSLKTYE